MIASVAVLVAYYDENEPWWISLVRQFFAQINLAAFFYAMFNLKTILIYVNVENDTVESIKDGLRKLKVLATIYTLFFGFTIFFDAPR